MIERLDEMEPDPDLEDDDPDASVEDDPKGFDPEEDMCLAGDDRVASGSCTGAMLICEDTGPGDADDQEPDGQEIRKRFTQSTRRRACIARRSRYTGRIDRYEFALEPTVPPKRSMLRRKRGCLVTHARSLNLSRRRDTSGVVSFGRRRPSS
jgi:hypothetical protein